jgi:hypothetical protein
VAHQQTEPVIAGTPVDGKVDERAQAVPAPEGTARR